jgi:hypothetical protein
MGVLRFYGWWRDPLRALVDAVGIAAYLTTNDKARYDAWLCLHAPAPSTGDNYGVEFARRWLRGGIPRRASDLSRRRDRFRPRWPISDAARELDECA